MTPAVPHSRAVLLALVCVLAAVGGGTGLVVADHDDGDGLDPFGLSDESDDDGLVPAWAEANPLERVLYGLGTMFGEPDGPTAAEHAANATSIVNNRSAGYVTLANECAGDRDLRNYDVVRINIEKHGEVATRYLRGNVSDGTAQSLTMGNTSDGRSVDYTLTIWGYSTTLISEDLVYIHQEYATTDECPGTGLAARLQGRYGTNYDISDGNVSAGE